ncbi:MAG TPA: DUF4105 domain-containing protein [Nitrospiria bacterium]|nr:DUF4105 domain-containing protein [Nitrospiria bacterium]
MSSSLRGYGLIKLSISLFLFQVISGIASPIMAISEDGRYIDQYLKSAEEMRLHEDRYWEILLHYKKSILGVKSLIDDPRFFLSPNGKYDPKSELDATIKAFFNAEPRDNNHPKCRFIARYSWLKEKIDIDGSQTPDIICQELDQAMDKIKPNRAVLVFPTAHINSPASMFGHTMVGISGAHQSQLLSYAANYAAFADDSNGFLYAFKGIFGYYKGYFSVLPYYEKVKEYSDLEQRDIWEYQLNLSKEETERMTLHLWELKDLYSDYYFFDENCSYNLLFLLEAARPRVNLTDKFGLWVLPLDTIRVIEKNGLVEKIEYRPSMAAKIKQIASLLDSDSRELALTIAVDESRLAETDLMEKDKKIRVLDLAAELIQYRYNKKVISKEEYIKRFLKTLEARSQLGRSEDPLYEIKAPPIPEKGHYPGRISLGIGLQEDSYFYEFKYRPAYHDLGDPDEGYIEGSQIVFAGLSARYDLDQERYRLEALDLIDIISLSPRDTFFKPVSWKVKTGFIRKTFSSDKKDLVYQLNPGGGIAFKNNNIGLFYVMFETDLNIGKPLERGYSVGIGPSLGLIARPADFWKINLSAKGIFYEIGTRHTRYIASVLHGLRISQNNSLNLGLSREKTFDLYQTEVSLSWNLYF